MRITILGLPGSGKTTLARKISEQKNITHINIDEFWLEGGGGYNSRTTPNPEETHDYVKEKVLEAIKQESWVSDGFYPLIQNKISDIADTIIFIDISLTKRLTNQIKRIFKHDKKGMTFWGNIMFLIEMIKMGSSGNARIRIFLKDYKDKVKVLKSAKEIEEYLNHR